MESDQNPPQSQEDTVIQTLEQYPASVLEAALRILEKRESKATR